MDRAITVIRRLLTAKAQVQSQDNLNGICSGQSSTEIGFPPNPSISTSQYNSTNAPYSFIHHSDGQRAH
jgi:hypothetical protein